MYTYSTGGASGATNYNWNVPINVGYIIADNGASIDVLIIGSVGETGSITMNASNDCGGSASRTLGLNVACRMAQVNSASGTSASLYPNPTMGNTTLKFEAATAGDYQVSVVDVTGRILSSETVHGIEGVNMHEIDLNNYAKGVYMVRMERSGEASQLLKVTVE